MSSLAAGRETAKKTLRNAKVKEFKLEKANTNAESRDSSLNPTEDIYDNKHVVQMTLQTNNKKIRKYEKYRPM